MEIRGSAPTGGEHYSTEQVEYSLDYIYQWEIAEGITLAGSSGFGTNGFADFGLVGDRPTEDNFFVLTQSAVLGYELGERNTLYAEWYGIFSRGCEHDFSISVFNIGIDHYVTDNFILDFRIGKGLNDDSSDVFAGVGGGYRF